MDYKSAILAIPSFTRPQHASDDPVPKLYLTLRQEEFPLVTDFAHELEHV